MGRQRFSEFSNPILLSWGSWFGPVRPPAAVNVEPTDLDFPSPDFQYIIRPGGTGRVKNAPVFGAQFGINF